MSRRKLIVAVERPGRAALHVSCRDLDDCLEVVKIETKKGRNVTGTRIVILEELAQWRVHGWGTQRELG